MILRQREPGLLDSFFLLLFFFVIFTWHDGVREDNTEQVVLQWNWTKEDSALAPSVPFTAMCSFTASIKNIFPHTPGVLHIAPLPSPYPHPWIISKLHFSKSLWIRRSVIRLSVHGNSKTPRWAERSGVCSRGKGAGRYSRSRDTEVESRYSSSCSLPALRVLILTCPDSPVGRLARGLEHECSVNLT